MRRWLVTARVRDVLQGSLPSDRDTISMLVHSPARVFADPEIVDHEYVITLDEPLTEPYSGEVSVARD